MKETKVNLYISTIISEWILYMNNKTGEKCPFERIFFNVIRTLKSNQEREKGYGHIILEII